MSIPQPPNVNPDSDEWWEYLYNSNTTPWELGDAAPPFKTFLSSPYAVPPGRMVVPGCGTGNEVVLFASQGFEVTGVDFCPSAVQATAQKLAAAGALGTKGFLLQRDFFSIHEYDRYFDYCLEHTCFCAIHPSRRRTYAMTVRDLLKPGGKLIALWWLLNHKGGPPFAVDKNEIFDLFSSYFSLDLSFAPQDSVPERQGKELFTVMTRLP
jgi:SAM-dependent methyltransferase